MSDIVRIETSARYSRAIIYNGTMFIGGQTADDRSQDVRGQTRQVLSKIDGYLAKAGSDKSRVLSAQVWLKDIARDFSAMNEVWDAWTAADASPTRATAQCEMATPDLLVEIIITAAADAG